MSVIVLISGFFITKTIMANRIMRSQITKNNIETVTAALSSYLANYNRLPLPAHDSNGYERKDPTSDLAHYVGCVPYNTLGMSAKSALDGETKPLIYIVEPCLTAGFSGVYEKSEFGGEQYFCYPFVDSKIEIEKITKLPDIIAFVIDTNENYPAISGKISVTALKNTFWITRDMLLIKYLKNCPCKAATLRSSTPIISF
jgi:hypothetical protein